MTAQEKVDRAFETWGAAMGWRPKPMTLYDLTTEWLEVLSLLDDGEIPPDLEQRLDAISGDRLTKIDNLRRVMANIKGRRLARELEANRLETAAERDRKHVEWLEEYLKQQMIRAGETRITTQLFDQVLCKAPPSVEYIGAMEELPATFLRVKTSVTVDKAGALAAWKAGETLPPGFIVQTDNKYLRLS